MDCSLASDSISDSIISDSNSTTPDSTSTISCRTTTPLSLTSSSVPIVSPPNISVPIITVRSIQSSGLAIDALPGRSLALFHLTPQRGDHASGGKVDTPNFGEPLPSRYLGE